MTSFFHWVSKLAYFVKYNIGYQPSKFQCSRLSGLNFTEGSEVENIHLCYETEKPSTYRVKASFYSVRNSKWNEDFKHSIPITSQLHQNFFSTHRIVTRHEIIATYLEIAFTTLCLLFLWSFCKFSSFMYDCLAKGILLILKATSNELCIHLITRANWFDWKTV